MIEIERKYLVKNYNFKLNLKGDLIAQGYLNSNIDRTVRIRIISNKGYITIKSKTDGISRKEFEYEIPIQDATDIIENICEKPIIKKIRYKVNYEGYIWEVDEFLNENEGLIVAEIELKDENDKFLKPEWVGEEVSNDPRYFNSSLITFSYKKWEKNSS